MIAINDDETSVCDRCNVGRVKFVECQAIWDREFLCNRCARVTSNDDGRKVAFSYQTDNTGHRKGKNWSKGGRK